jgi:hypothetical protein
MFNYNPLDCLPSSAELPDSDDTPVDNELQILIPNLLLVHEGRSTEADGRRRKSF